MSIRGSRPSRPPVTWSTHWQHILFVLSVVVGGSLFGVSYALWPLRPIERALGVAIVVGVVAVLVWLVIYLLRPVQRPPRRGASRR